MNKKIISNIIIDKKRDIKFHYLIIIIKYTNMLTTHICFISIRI